MCEDKKSQFRTDSLDMTRRISRVRQRVELKNKLMNLEGVLQMEKYRGESHLEIMKRADGVWWESSIEELKLFQLQHLKKALETLNQKVEKEIQMMNNNAFPFQSLGSAWTLPSFY